jgi:hypothetical protein
MEQRTAFVNHDATVPHTNVYAIKARNAKASKMADVLLLHGASSAEARALPVECRRTVATLAGVRVPSATTWELVCDLLACVERSRAVTSLVERLIDAWLYA